MLSLVPSAYRVPCAGASIPTFQTRVPRARHLSSVGHVQKRCSQHCDSGWRSGPCDDTLHLGPPGAASRHSCSGELHLPLCCWDPYKAYTTPGLAPRESGEQVLNFYFIFFGPCHVISLAMEAQSLYYWTTKEESSLPLLLNQAQSHSIGLSDARQKHPCLGPIWGICNTASPRVQCTPMSSPV